MPFIPHTEDDVRRMLDVIGADSIEQLFDEIPEELKCRSFDAIPEGLTEMEVAVIMQQRAAQDANALCFIGAGSYDHHIPAAVWELTTRGEYYTAYTPYQPEVSQGTLQAIYEYQTLTARLLGMEVNKVPYNAVMWTIIVILLALLVAGYLAFTQLNHGMADVG